MHSDHWFKGFLYHSFVIFPHTVYNLNTLCDDVSILLISLYFFYFQAATNTVLANIGRPDLQFSPQEWNLGQHLVTFLASFRRITEILSSSKPCTINLALLFR